MRMIKFRPIRIKFATQVQAEEVLSGSWRLSGDEVDKNVWINRDLDEAERLKQKELINEAKQKKRAANRGGKATVVLESE